MGVAVVDWFCVWGGVGGAVIDALKEGEGFVADVLREVGEGWGVAGVE